MIRLSDYLPTLKEASNGQREEFAKRTARTYIAPAFTSEWSTWYVHEGNLTIPCDVYNDMSLVVHGDVIVDGTYDDYIESQTGSIACFGSMHAENVFSWGAVYVEKDLVVNGIVHTVYNDHSFEVLGTVFARALLVDDKATNEPKHECEIFANDQALDADALRKAVKQCKKVFPKLVWPADVDGEDDRLPDFDRMRAFVYRGEKLFAKPRSKKSGTAGSISKKSIEPLTNSDWNSLESVAIPFPSFDEWREQDEELRNRDEEKESKPNFEELELLVSTGSVEQKKEVAEAAINSQGAFDDYHDVRDKTLERFMLDASPAVRKIASCGWLRQKFYDENAEHLSSDKVDDIRFVFALRCRHKETLVELLKDKSLEVRCAVLMNPNTPGEAMREFVESLDGSQSEEELGELIGSLLQNSLLPPDLLELLYRKCSNEMLVRHLNAPADIVVEQMGIEVKNSNSALARKISELQSTQEVFALLASTNDGALQRIAACNRHSPEVVLFELDKKSKGNESLRWFLAVNPSLPSALYDRYEKDETRVRASLATNPSCPIDILRRLAQNDDSAAVRQTAKLTLQKLHGVDLD